MKRMGFVFACVLVAVAALSPVVAHGAETFAKYVPDGPLFYATTQNFEGFWRGIEDSNFWAKFGRLKIWEGVDFGWYDEFREEFAEDLGFEFSTENVMALFGKEFAAALYLDPGEDQGAGLRVEVIFVAQMNPPDAVEGMVEKLLGRAKEEGKDDVLVTSVEHQGVKVQTIKGKDDDPPIQLRWAMKEGVLVVGIGNAPPRIEACLDCMAGDGSSLAADETFDTLLGMAQQDRGTFFGECYFSFDALQKVVSRLAADRPELVPLADFLEVFSGSTGAMATTTHLDHGLRMKFAMEPGPEMDEIMALMRQAPPSAGTHIKYVPPDALLYYGANSMPPLAELWPYAMKQWAKLGVGEMIADGIEQLELALGIDFEEDLLANCGTEMAFVLEGLDVEGGAFPFPKLTILLQAKEKAKAEAFIGKVIGLLEEGVLPETEVAVTDLAHHGAALKVITITLPMVEVELTPTIGITENFLFISSGEAYAKATLDSAKRGASLLSSPLYRSLGIPEKTNAVMFINMEEMGKAARGVVDWVVAMAEMQGVGAEAKQQVDEYVLPLLDCLSVLKAIAGYSVVTPESMTGVYVFRVEDLPAD